MLAERPLPGDLERRIKALGSAGTEDRDVAAVYLFGTRQPVAVVRGRTST
jgi:hypothetical protein